MTSTQSNKPMRPSRMPLPGIRGGIPSHKDPSKLDFLTRFQEDVRGDMFDADEDDMADQLELLGLSEKSSDLLQTPPKGKRLQSHHRITTDWSSQPSSGGGYLASVDAADADTIATQIDDADFEDLDNIFGANESGINQVSEKLLQKQQQMLNEAENEQRYFQDLRRLPSLRSNIASEHTLINARQDGREVSPTGSEMELQDDAVLPNSTNDTKRVRTKSSLPTLLSNSRPNVRKFRSTVGFAVNNLGRGGAYFDENDEHSSLDDGVNYDNNVKRKLDRIPSFYRANPASKMLLERKAQILGTYREMDCASPVRVKMGRVPYPESDQAVPAFSTPMKFDEARFQQGNDIDLARFGNSYLASLERDNDNAHMVYDAVNMRWINLDQERTQDCDAVFEDIPDLHSPRKRYVLAPPQRDSNADDRVNGSPRGARQPSSQTQRTVSSCDHQAMPQSTLEFVLSDKQKERFEREAEKLLKKTRNWFLESELHEGKALAPLSYTYYWDIRNMVMENR